MLLINSSNDVCIVDAIFLATIHTKLFNCGISNILLMGMFLLYYGQVNLNSDTLKNGLVL